MCLRLNYINMTTDNMSVTVIQRERGRDSELHGTVMQCGKNLLN